MTVSKHSTGQSGAVFDLAGALDVLSPQGDDAAIAARLVQHRIGGRAIAALDGGATILGRAARDVLEAEQRDIEGAFAVHAAALRSLASAYLAPSSPAVLLKGYAAHLTLGTPASLRRTLDIDLVCARPEPLLDAVRRGDAETYRRPSPHELANARFFGADLDLHAHYPVWAFAPSAPTRIVEVGDGRVACHAGRLSVTPLASEELLAGAAPAGALGTSLVRVPDPSAAIMVLAAHVYRNAISRSSVSIREKPPIRFAELVEIRDLVGHARFDARRLVSLTRALGGHRTLALTGQLLHTLFLDERIAELAAPANADDDSLEVSIWGGIWADLKYDARTLLTRHASTMDVVRALDGAHVVCDLGTPVRLAPSSEGGDLLSNGALLHAFQDPAAIDLVRGAVTRTAETLTVELETREITDAPNRRVGIDVAGFALEVNWSRDADAVSIKQSDRSIAPRVAFRREGSRHVLRIALSLSDDPMLQARSLPILVGVGEFERVHAMRAGLLVPLVLDTGEGGPP